MRAAVRRRQQAAARDLDRLLAGRLAVAGAGDAHRHCGRERARAAGAPAARGRRRAEALSSGGGCDAFPQDRAQPRQPQDRSHPRPPDRPRHDRALPGRRARPFRGFRLGFSNDGAPLLHDRPCRPALGRSAHPLAQGIRARRFSHLTRRPHAHAGDRHRVPHHRDSRRL